MRSPPFGAHLRLRREARYAIRRCWLASGTPPALIPPTGSSNLLAVLQSVFVSLALLILAGALACYAGECVIAWASKAARETPKVVLGPPEIQLKTIPADGKLK